MDGMERAFLYGAIFLGFLVISFFFFCFWQKSKDRFFAIFSGAFLLMAIEVLITAATNPDQTTRPVIYLLRLSAFILIIVAIADKNRDQLKSE